MSRGRKVALLALGALVSVAAAPASAQVVVGEYRPSVDVNWDVLDKLGPEPTLPGLVTRPPSAAIPAAAPRPVARPAAAKAATFKPYAEATPRAAAPKAAAPKAKVETAATAPKAAIPAVITAPEPARAEQVKPEPAPGASGPAPRPAKPDIVADVPPPPPKAPEPAKVEPAKAPEPPKAAEPSPKAPEQPSAVQFVKTPPPAAPAPAPTPAPSPAPVVQAPPLPVAPPPVAAPPVAAPTPPPQVAALPAAAPVSTAAPGRRGDNLTVPFATDSSHLPDSARAELDRLAQRMDKDESLNLQLLAYAAGDEANASKARRLSLSRALEVRKYLMEMGVRSTRIEVRALGNKVEGGTPDRVDAMLVAR